MAKVTGPLMSVDARGKLADAIVFSGWRGLKTVRQWLKPANPNTEAQQIQRARFSDAVSTYQSLPAQDADAWRLKAAGTQMSGFNLLVKKICDAKKADLIWVNIRDVEATSVSDSGFTVTGTTSSSDLVSVKVGSDPGVYTKEFTEAPGRTDPGTFSVVISGLISDITYYYEVISPTTPTSTGQSGIYSQRTL